MTTVKLTKTIIDKEQPGDDDKIIWDSIISGFGMKIAPTGRKTFILKYTTKDGRQRKPTIGKFGDITLEQARTKAQVWKGQIADGNDPAADRGSRQSSYTLNDYAKDYFSCAQKKASTLHTDQTNYRNHVEKTLGRKSLRNLNQSDILAWFRKLEGTPGVANRTLSLLGAMLNEAERQGLRDTNSNPVSKIKRYPSSKRQRYLSREELGRLGAVLDEIEAKQFMNPSIVPAVRLLLFTGARKSEILGLKWDWIDWDQRVIRLPDSKTGARDVPLSSLSIEVLKSLPRNEGNPYVLPGRMPGDHLKGLTKAFHKILEMAEIEDFRIHDLRHTNASHGAMAGIPLQMISKSLGHSKIQSTERYAHLNRAPVVQTNEAISLAIAEGLRGGNNSPSEAP